MPSLHGEGSCLWNLSTELMLFRCLQRFGYLQCRMTVAELMNKSDHDLFCKLCAPTHAFNHLLENIHTSYQNILLIFIRNLFLSVLYMALSSEIVFIVLYFFWFCCFVLYVILTLLFMFFVQCAFVGSNKYYIHTYIHTAAYPFLLQDWLHDSPDFYVTFEHICFYFLVFSVFHFLVVVSVR